jgi:3-hydroxybutyryl-CoA dehydratase
MQVGNVHWFERTFNEEDVRLFSLLSQDKGVHHILPDKHGRLRVHGLLTATLPTMLGSVLNFISRVAVYEFERPVYAGDTIQCEVTIDSIEEKEKLFEVSIHWICRNQNGLVVLTGNSKGAVFKQRTQKE